MFNDYLEAGTLVKIRKTGEVVEVARDYRSELEDIVSYVIETKKNQNCFSIEELEPV